MQDLERLSHGKLRHLILWQELGVGSSNLPVAGEGQFIFPGPWVKLDQCWSLGTHDLPFSREKMEGLLKAIYRPQKQNKNRKVIILKQGGALKPAA